MKSWAVAGATLLLATTAIAQQFQPPTPRPPMESVEFRSSDLANRTYLLRGVGGNIVLAVGDDGVIMIDSEFAELATKLRTAIAAITPLPVRYVIVTHFHRDHTGGNEAFARSGATIVAHGNARARLASGTTNGLTGNVLPPAPPVALPRLVYDRALTVEVRGRNAELRHLVAHTDGDTYVYIPDANVLVTGDIITFGRYPNIDVPYGGSIDGIIAGVDVLLGVGDENTRVVPGHGPPGTKTDVRAYRQMLVEARRRIAALIAEGKSEDEAVSARPNAESDAGLGVTPQAAGNFVRVAYRSLKK